MQQKLWKGLLLYKAKFLGVMFFLIGKENWLIYICINFINLYLPTSQVYESHYAIFKLCTIFCSLGTQFIFISEQINRKLNCKQ